MSQSTEDDGVYASSSSSIRLPPISTGHLAASDSAQPVSAAPTEPSRSQASVAAPADDNISTRRRGTLRTSLRAQMVVSPHTQPVSILAGSPVSDANTTREGDHTMTSQAQPVHTARLSGRSAISRSITLSGLPARQTASPYAQPVPSTAAAAAVAAVGASTGRQSDRSSLRRRTLHTSTVAAAILQQRPATLEEQNALLRRQLQTTQKELCDLLTYSARTQSSVAAPLPASSTNSNGPGSSASAVAVPSPTARRNSNSQSHAKLSDQREQMLLQTIRDQDRTILRLHQELQLAGTVEGNLRQQCEILTDRLSTCDNAYTAALEQLQNASTRNEALSLELEQTRGTCERLAAILRQAQRDNEKQTVVLSNKLNLDTDPSSMNRRTLRERLKERQGVAPKADSDVQASSTDGADSAQSSHSAGDHSTVPIIDGAVSPAMGGQATPTPTLSLKSRRSLRQTSRRRTKITPSEATEYLSADGGSSSPDSSKSTVQPASDHLNEQNPGTASTRQLVPSKPPSPAPTGDILISPADAKRRLSNERKSRPPSSTKGLEVKARADTGADAADLSAHGPPNTLRQADTDTHTSAVHDHSIGDELTRRAVLRGSLRGARKTKLSCAEIKSHLQRLQHDVDVIKQDGALPAPISDAGAGGSAALQ